MAGVEAAAGPQWKGRLVVVLFFVTGLAMAGYAWWHTYQRGRQSLQFWGEDAALAIRYAPTVEVWRLEPAAAVDVPAVILGDQALRIAAQRTITDVPGLVHARHALIEDASFQWSAAETGACQPQWQFALVFSHPDRRTVVVFDPQCDQVTLLGSGRSERLQAPRMAAFAAKLEHWFEG